MHGGHEHDASPRAQSSCCRLTTALLGLAFTAVLWLHLAEPALGITWSYAHLGRRAALPWLAVVVTVALPLLGGLAWSSGVGRGRPWRPSRTATAAAVVLLWIGLSAIGLVAPAPRFTLDGWFLEEAVSGKVPRVPRWFLTAWTLSTAASWLRPAALRLDRFIIVANALPASVSLVAIAGACRLLARDAREAWATALLALTAFGSIQLAIGYVDVYPFALATTALFFWTALRAVEGEGHPAWPVTIAAIGPFIYFGLLLLVPSALVVLFLTARQPGGARRALTAAGAGILAAGAATLPIRRLAFDWVVFAQQVWRGRAHKGGLLDDSSLLPGWYMWSGQHAAEVAHTLLLIDPVGLILLVVAGGALLARAPRATLDGPSLVLLAFVGGFLAYLWTMDALYGAFADWDLFSYGAVATSLAGAYAFIRLGRQCPRPFGVLLGLALAVSGVHLMARLNALDVESERHATESPLHTLPSAPVPAARIPAAAAKPRALPSPAPR